jgi:hypothetical protein
MHSATSQAQKKSMLNKRIKNAHSRSLGRRYRGAPYAGRYTL